MSLPASDPEQETPAAVELASAPDVAAPNAMHVIGPESATTARPQAADTDLSEPSERIPDGWTLIALVPFEGREPPGSVSDELAQAVWCAVTSLWHPALLASAAELPRIESIEFPSPPGAREIRVIAGGLWDQLPSGYRTQAEDAKSLLLESGTDRGMLIDQIRVKLGSDNSGLPVESDGMVNSAADFLALGTVHWILRDLTIAMGRSDSIDVESLARELLAGSHEWRIDNWSGAVNRLRAAFENLTHVRERFYPVDLYLLDLCMIDSGMREGVLAQALARPVAISFIMQA